MRVLARAVMFALVTLAMPGGCFTRVPAFGQEKPAPYPEDFCKGAATERDMLRVLVGEVRRHRDSLETAASSLSADLEKSRAEVKRLAPKTEPRK